MTGPTPRVPRLPFVLLGLMTAATLGGPLAIGYVLRGGPKPDWPPDRPVEWFTLGATSAMVLVLMLACLSLALVNRKAIPKGVEPDRRDRPGVGP